MNTQPFKINSIAVPLVGTSYLREGNGLVPMEQFISSMKATGFNDVRLITTSGVMANSTDAAYSQALTASFEPPDAEVLTFATRLKSEGFMLTWMPFIGMNGQITGSGTGGDKANPANFDAWFENHKAAMVHEARLAQSVGAERFVVFTDDVQNLMYSQPGSARAAKWLELVSAVRAVYSGEVTAVLYADGTLFPGGNNHLQLIPRAVLDSLDTIGVGFFPDPLTKSTNPSVNELINAWYENGRGVRPVDLLKSISDFYGKKVWIGDRTFHSFDGANIDHGQVLRATPPLVPDQQEQADLMESFLRVMSLEQGTWFNGVSLQNWNRFPDYTAGVARFLDSAVGENFQGKLAEQVVSDWFNGLRQSTGVTRNGTAQADQLEGGYHHDSLAGLAGDDNLDGGSGVDTGRFTGKITDYFIKYNRALGTATITDHRANADGTDSLKSIEKLQFADKTFDLLNPARTESAAFGKSQSFLFDPAYYLLKHPDLVPTVTLATAFDSYKTTAAQGAAPNAWFDPAYYANRWADLKPLNLDAVTLFAHYNLYGVWEGRSAGPTFDKYDGTRYLKDNPDVAAYVDAYVKDFLGSRSNGAIAHYVIYGAAEGRVAFDTAGVAIEQAILIGVA
jgi:hypothetical protein